MAAIPGWLWNLLAINELQRIGQNLTRPERLTSQFPAGLTLPF